MRQNREITIKPLGLVLVVACTGQGSGSLTTRVVAGAQFTCAASATGVVCWGEGRDGELDGATDTLFLPHPTPTAAGIGPVAESPPVIATSA